MSHHIETSPNREVRACWYSVLFGGTPPPTGQAADWSSVVPHHIEISPNRKVRACWFSGPVRRYTASNGSGHRLEPCCHCHIVTSPNRKVWACSFSALFGGTPPPTGQVTDWSSVVTATLKQARTERFGLVGFLSCSAVHRLQRVQPQIGVLLSPPH